MAQVGRVVKVLALIQRCITVYWGSGISYRDQARQEVPSCLLKGRLLPFKEQCVQRQYTVGCTSALNAPIIDHWQLSCRIAA